MGATRKQKEQEQEQEEAIRHLREILKPGDKVYGIVRTVSRSGMSRTIDFYAFKPHECECPQTGPGANHEPGCPGDVIDRVYLSGWIATVLDYRQTDQGALKVQGCGMDMIFHVVYNLSRRLFPDGFGVACEKCGRRPSSGGRVHGICDDSDRHLFAHPDGMTFEEWDAKRAALSGLYALSDHEYWGRNGDRSGWDTDGGYALKAETL